MNLKMIEEELLTCNGCGMMFPEEKMKLHAKMCLAGLVFHQESKTHIEENVAIKEKDNTKERLADNSFDIMTIMNSAVTFDISSSSDFSGGGGDFGGGGASGDW